jgi:hypothetical protein
MPTEKSGYRKKSLQPLQSKGFTLNTGLHFGLSHAPNAAWGLLVVSIRKMLHSTSALQSFAPAISSLRLQVGLIVNIE